MKEGGEHRDFNIAKALGEDRENAFLRAITNTDAEHKFDEKARKTGNVFIEYKQGRPHRPSGIATTKAPIYLVEYDDDCWLVLRTPLVKQLTRRAIEEGRTRAGGDNNNLGALVPLSWLLTPWASVTTTSTRAA